MRPTVQTPHTQDELYVIAPPAMECCSTTASDSFEAGDLLFVAAGTEHQFETCSTDLAVWVVFYGVKGGEVAKS